MIDLIGVQILTMVIGLRQRIVEETDGPEKDKESDDDGDEEIRREVTKLKGPSGDAVAKFEDYRERLDVSASRVVV